METHDNTFFNWIFGILNLLFGGLITSLHLSKFQENRAREKEQEKDDALMKEFREQNEQDHRDLWAQKVDDKVLQIILRDIKEIKESVSRIESRSHQHRGKELS